MRNWSFSLKIKWFFNISYSYFYLFAGNLFLFLLIGNGLILESDSQNLDLESTDGVIELSNQFLLEFLIMLSLSTVIFYILLVKYRKSGLKVLFGFSLSFIYLSSITEIFYFAFEKDSISDVKQFNLLITAILVLILGI